MSQQFQTPIPTLPSTIQALLHPAPTLIDDSLPSYLTNSMIHVLRDSSRAATKRRRKLEMELRDAGLHIDGNGSGPGPSTLKGRKDVEPELDKVKREQGEEEKETEIGLKERLEAIGRTVGAQIVEQSVFRMGITLRPLFIQPDRRPLSFFMSITVAVPPRFFRHS
jgi:hypothetical protein